MLRFGAFDSGGETGLFARSSVDFNNAGLAGLVYCFIRHGEQFLGAGNIFGGERLHKRLRHVLKCVLAAQVEDMLLRRGAYRFLC